MRGVTDREGRSWTIDITVATVERVKAAFKVDMPSLFGDKMQALDALMFDPSFPAVVFECCRPSAEKAGQTLEMLKEVWNGQFADAVIDAWLEELIDFFPNARHRESLRSSLKTIREINTQIVEGAAAMMSPEAMQETVTKALASLRQKSPATSGEPSGDLPATSDSTPAPSPSGN